MRDADLTAAFDHAARGYDTLVAANPGYHRQLRRSARRVGLAHRGAGMRVLDLGCGTGASTAALLRAAPHAHVTAVDASAGMLRRAQAKRWPGNVTFVQSAAETLTRAGVRGPFDAVFAAYLFRNLTDPDPVLARVRDLLVPGGVLAVHEYALSGRPAHRAVWTAVCKGIVQPVGTMTGDRALYQHLWRSVIAFDTAPAFADRLTRAGFVQPMILPVAGWQTGIVHTVLARRPAAGGQASR
ncbi:class I SAM-dependent methyltransferase [Streptomyces bryophytorum]|nr:class I SAM-dependent methyltransferase [Actinacidiphila bryophytorum]MBN6541578.1 class I SAM-dependent methyltransferase [Actinacidiphila bryophytorum]